MLRTITKWEEEKDGKNRNGVEETNAAWRFFKKSRKSKLEVKYQNSIS